MPAPHFYLRPTVVATLLALNAVAALAQTNATEPASSSGTLNTITVEASADASAEGLAKPYAGGQVARGGRVGILGTQDVMSTPFSTTSYTNELIQNQQARSVGDVLQNDPTVRIARGFGNFQESYFIRGFIVNSDDVGYNGLYGLLPRQYISSELFERVEVLRGASTFLTGATPTGGGIGGNINLLPKRASNEPLTQLTFGMASGSQGYVATDIARRFGPDQSLGIRVNAAHREGGTAVNDEKVKLDMFSVGFDWRSRDARFSADIGHQEHRLTRARPNVTLVGLKSVPAAPDNKTNYAQPWTFSNERDTFGSVRGEYDITPDITAWAAGGMRRGNEANSLAGINVTDALTGASTTSRFDNTREDRVKTTELGLRGKFRTGSVGHEWVGAYSFFQLEKDNAYALGLGANSTLSTNIYSPLGYPAPALTYLGNDLSNPAINGRTRLSSFAFGDTLSFFDDRAKLTLGLRRQTIATEDISFHVANNGIATDVGGAKTGYDQSRTSPVAGFVFKATDNLSVYANYIEGLSAGDTAPAKQANGALVANAGEQLKPYVSKQKEIGLKYDGGQIGGGIAVFSTDKPRAIIDSANNYTTNGKDRHQGVELTVFGEPTKGLRVLGGLTLLDAKQRSTGASATDGKYVIGVAKTQASIGLDWDVPGVRGLSLNGRIAATGHSFADATNTLRVPGWARLDVGARYVTEVAGKLVTLRARIDNLTNRNYWASVGGYPDNGYLVLGAPRSFTLSGTIDF